MSVLQTGPSTFDWEDVYVSPVQHEQTEAERAILPSETAVLNDALAQIGASRISGIDDTSLNAVHCKTFYPPLLDSCLRMTHWKFATAQAILQVSTTPPLFDYPFAYDLPSDCLKVQYYNGGLVNAQNLTLWSGGWIMRFRIMGKKLLSREAQVGIQYTRRVTDPAMWNSLFYQFMVAMLASKLANAIPKDEKKAAAKLEEALKMWLPMALTADGQEQDIIAIVSDSLTWGRDSLYSVPGGPNWWF